MKNCLSLFLFSMLVLQIGYAQPIDTTQDATTDTSISEMQGLIFSDDGEEVSIGNFWDLIRQAGPIRYPIFGIFLVGVFLISMKAFELFMDMRQSMAMEKTSLRKMNLNEVSVLVAKQPDNMLSRISSTLLNVFQTSENTESLHDEVVNYIRFQQDSFGTFRSRIDFLSDTAGALGLLGTVWGMFIVFSSGDLEKEIILTGMGIALLTTLLGLVVSIALNFSSTLAHGYFMKRLDQVKAKAEEMRFRLLEIENRRSKAVPSPPSPVNSNHAVPAGHNSGPYLHEDGVEEEETEEEVIHPAYLLIESGISEAVAGSRLKEIGISVTDHHDKAVKNEVITLSVTGGDGQLNKSELTTDASGHAWFNWKLGQKTGQQSVDAKVEGSTDQDLAQRLTINAVAGEPRKLILKTNHQSGLPGKALRNPLLAVVADEYGNAVEGCNVHLEITTGNGKLEQGKQSVVLTTNKDGEISTELTLDEEPGFNVVDISVKKAGIAKKYQAMGQEVLV
ncbi:MAG: MotA/TolQ/ExbB proton channel family protein [Balneolales bacterium]